MTQRVVQTPALTLYAGIAAADTSMTVTPYPVDLNGVKLLIADFGDTPTVTIDPKVSGYEEIVSFTAIVDNGDDTATLTGLTRNLPSKYPYTSAGTGKVHGASAVVVFSDNPQIFGRLASKENDETISGSWSFPTPVLPANPARLSDLAAAVMGVAPSASSSIQGSTKLSKDPSLSLGTATITIASPAVVSLATHGLIANDQVKFTTTNTLPTGIVAGTVYYVISAGLTSGAFEISATLGGTAINTSGSQSGVHTLFRVTPFAVGDNDPRVFPNAYAADAGANDTYVITLPTAPTAYVTGQLFAFKANTVNTGAATLNVNSLGAKTIVKNVSDTLSDGDIGAGQIVLVIYDGTNFRLLSNTTDTQVFTASGTWTKPLNARTVWVYLIGGGAGGGSGASGTNAGGGAGGSVGAVMQAVFQATNLTATVAVTVGTAGAGGAAVSGNPTLGNPGASGVASSFGAFVTAAGGAAGIAGASNSAGGAQGVATLGFLPQTGGGGGGVTNGSGSSGSTSLFNSAITGGAGGSGGGAGTAGSVGTAATANIWMLGGSGGGGGASNSTAAYAGGAGGIYGGGGGGGGASATVGSLSGAGGAGAAGIVVVVTTK